MNRTEPLVRHAKYGWGTVQAKIGPGQVRVYFDSIGGTRVVPDTELEPHGATPRVGRPVPIPTPASEERAGSEELQDARLTLECLRQGLPPIGRVEAWTAGFSDVRTALETAIENARRAAKGSTIVVEGSYGQGKSHAGELVREIALKRDVMVLRADLDGQGVSLARSGRLVARLLASLELPTGTGAARFPGLGSLLRLAASKLRGGVPPGCELLAPVLEHATEWEGSEEVIVLLEDYLAGERNRVQLEFDLRRMLSGVAPRLPPLKTNWGTLEARISAQMKVLSSIVALSIATGATGALLVIDELDHEIHSRDWPRSVWVLRTLVDLARRSPLVVVLLSPSSLDLADVRHVRLRPLDRADLRSLVFRTVDVYRAAFPDKLSRGQEERLFEKLWALYKREYEALGWGPRFFVRAAVEACERAAAHGRPPGRALD